MIALRSILFNGAFFVGSALLMVSLLLALPLPRRVMLWAGRQWAAMTNALLVHVVGAEIEVRGTAPTGAAVVASKHESAWETAALQGLLADYCFVLKRELTWIPIFGWLIRKNRQIVVDRDAGASALKRLLTDVGEALGAGRQIVIFPEGTRVAPGADRDYQPGIAAIYRRFDAPVIPVALTSGTVWGRRSFLKRPGRIILSFLEPMPGGLDRPAFEAELRHRIETASAALRAEAAVANPRRTAA